MSDNIVTFKNLEDQFRYQIPPILDYLLDSYVAFAAYSVRQLSSTATNSMRVRRSSDNAELDIGFADGWLDEAAIAAHCGAGNGYITTWYDQSGNGNDCTQAIAGAQALIYNGSATFQLNGRPAANEDNRSSITYEGTIPDNAQPVTASYVGILEKASSPFGGGFSLFGNGMELGSSSSNARMDAGATLESPESVTKDAQTHYICLFNSVASIMRGNGSELVAGDAGSVSTGTNIRIMSKANASFHSESFQEAVFFGSDQTANFSAIESDINTAFGIY